MLITNASRLSDFFVVFFFVPKIVPKIKSYQFREKIFFLMYVEYQK